VAACPGRDNRGVTRHRSTLLATVVAIIAPVLISLAMVPIRDSRIAPGMAVVLVLPVVVAAALGGWRTGAVAAVMGALSFDVLLTAPYGSLRIDGADDVLVPVVFLVVGLVVSHLVTDRRRSEQRAAHHEDNLQSLRRYAGIEAGSDDLGWLIRSACTELSDLLGGPEVEYRPGPAPEGMTRLAHGKVIVPAGGLGPATTDGTTVALPVDRAGRHLAHLLIHYPDTGIFGVPLQRRAQAVAVADMLGAAIDRGAPMSWN
jgi:hypothetical protein